MRKNYKRYKCQFFIIIFIRSFLFEQLIVKDLDYQRNQYKLALF
jgi:hypothetical protein